MFKNCIQNCLHLLKLMHFLDFSYFFRKWWLATLCTAAALSTVFTAVRPSWMCSLAKLRDCCSHRHRLCCHFWTHGGVLSLNLLLLPVFINFGLWTLLNVGHVGIHCMSGPVVMRGCLRNFYWQKNLLQTHRKRVLCALLYV